ncbi:phosphoribosylformylglycinamidine synthase subunit PurL [bacterium]|nr:phosphoribosylformylglycinamidine synthase subunit PurL [bacterium]
MEAAIDVSRLEDADLERELRAHGLTLKLSEARRIGELLGRAPTLTELTLFDTMWSEHCSYKSSREHLKRWLPTEGPDVVLGPVEDAGIVRLGEADGRRWCLVIGHESHNHPSQVLPFEGAATGIGGIVRDVYCMGATVVGVLDPLRFGDPRGAEAARSRAIMAGVVDGIWHYANALGVPNLGGDLVFHPGYDDNCLVNVVAVGLVPEDEIVRSRVPAEAATEPYDFILVGKPTDESGFGGAAFASVILDEGVENRGAVQVPDPFLKRVLSEANKAVLAAARAAGIAIGFKDLGAGGIACVSSELAEAGGFGMRVYLDRVHVADERLASRVIACSETQERYGWAVPRRFSPQVLKIYNEDFDLPHVYRGAAARVVGEVTRDGRYTLTRGEDRLCDAPVSVVTSGIRYERESAPRRQEPPAPALDPARDLAADLLALLADPNLCDRSYLYQHYDGEVQGHACLRPGEGDSGVSAPFQSSPLGFAVTCDGNPFYGERDPYLGGALAVCEAVRNLACQGAWPLALTDCLNYGNPEKPGPFGAFVEGVRGVGEACRAIGRLSEDDRGPAPRHPIPVVSGNVSFYNESARGAAIPPSPIVALLGRVPDVSRVPGQQLLAAGDPVVLLGPRAGALGGGAYHRVVLGSAGGALPAPDFARLRAEALVVIEAAQAGWIRAAHDVGEGGVAVAAAEMLLGRRPGALGLGLELDLPAGALAPAAALFDETGGFLLEVAPAHLEEFRARCRAAGIAPVATGRVTADGRLLLAVDGAARVELALADLAAAWQGTLPALFPQSAQAAEASR